MEILNDMKGNVTGKVILTKEDVKDLKNGLEYVLFMFQEETTRQKTLYDKLTILEEKLP